MAAEAFPTAWLADQRWFRGKGRALSTVELGDAAQLPGGRGWLLVLEATDAAGAEARYLVPAIEEAGRLREPRDDEGVWSTLVRLIAAGGELPAAGGRFVCTPAPGLADLLPPGTASGAMIPERRLAVEQSNTSVVLGDRLILKAYRLLEAGENPEVEVCAFLAAAGFAHAPALGGAMTYLPSTAAPSAAALLQEYVPAVSDGWRWALDALAGGAATESALLAGLTEIGTTTREMHAALASRPDSAAFPVRRAIDADLSRWRASAEGQLAAARAAVGRDAAKTVRVEALAPAIRAAFAAIELARDATVSRIHGDYHLGQLLRTEGGFVVIDFEGEPARTLADRRAPASPLRDVAGMLRSLDYAAQVAHREHGLPDDPEAWLRRGSAAFLAGYGGLDPAAERLCRALEIEKACYELHYEANNRPEWTWLPLAALERLSRQRPA